MNQEQKLAALRREIQRGLDSGPSSPMDMAAIKAEARLQRFAKQNNFNIG